MLKQEKESPGHRERMLTIQRQGECRADWGWGTIFSPAHSGLKLYTFRPCGLCPFFPPLSHQHRGHPSPSASHALSHCSQLLVLHYSQHGVLPHITLPVPCPSAVQKALV